MTEIGQESRSKNEDLLNNKSLSSYRPTFLSSKSAPIPAFRLGGRRCAFTLAEVLITLGIIGVVAALTLPTLIQKYQEKATVTKLKKVYSVLNQAYQRATEEYGSIEHWGFNENASTTTDTETGEIKLSEATYANAQIFWHNLSKFINTTYECYTSDCTPKKDDIKTLSGRSRNTDMTAILKTNDGYAFIGGWITPYVLSCLNTPNGYCGNFSVDINGIENQPNQVGRDIFYFKITKNGILPHGMFNDRADTTFPEACNLTSSDNGNGYGCTAWVIYNENMDYLHCDGLSWDGKHKCK